MSYGLALAGDHPGGGRPHDLAETVTETKEGMTVVNADYDGPDVNPNVNPPGVSKPYEGRVDVAAVGSGTFPDQVDVWIERGPNEPAPVRITVAPEEGPAATAYLDVEAAEELMRAIGAAIARVRGD